MITPIRKAIGLTGKVKTALVRCPTRCEASTKLYTGFLYQPAKGRTYSVGHKQLAQHLKRV